jgi:hypothetical protein
MIQTPPPEETAFVYTVLYAMELGARMRELLKPINEARAQLIELRYNPTLVQTPEHRMLCRQTRRLLQEVL